MNKLSLIQQIQRFFQIGISWRNFITFFSGSCNAISQFTAQSKL